MSIVQLRDVWARYPRPFWSAEGPWVLESIDLEVWPGEVLGIVGASGGGKSTLARVICGDLSPARGAVHWEGERRAGRPPPSVVQRLFQATSAHLPPHLHIAGAMAETVAVHGGGERTEAVLRRLGLWERRLAPPTQLSGGERRRAGIARLALTRPRLLILDEPTAGLDAHRAVEAMALLLDARPSDSAVLIITHDLRVVRAFADRVAVMSQGRIIEECAAAQLGGAVHHPRTAALLAPEGPLELRQGPGCPHVGWCPLPTTDGCRTEPPRLRAVGSAADRASRVACHALAPPELP